VTGFEVASGFACFLAGSVLTNVLVLRWHAAQRRDWKSAYDELEADADREITELEDRLRYAEREAFYKAEEHFAMRTKHLQASYDVMLRNAAMATSMSPITSVLWAKDKSV